MPFFSQRPRRLSADFIAVPREPSALDRLVDEARIAELDEQIYRAQRLGRAADRDRLIDLRNAIRPARVAEVPVIPGRPS
jgi:hypothetical protein